MSHKIDTITPPSSGTCVPVGTKVTENAVITGDAEQCKCHDNEENTLIRQYETMIAAAEHAKAEFLVKSALLDLLALQGDNPAATNSAILNALQNLDLSSITVAVDNTKTALQGDDTTATNTALKGLITSIAAAVAAITGYATETNATANKNAIISALGDIDLSSIISLIGSSTDEASAATLFGRIAAILAAFSGITIDTSNLATKAVNQYLGLAESYEAAAVYGEEVTENKVIDELKSAFSAEFQNLLPNGFNMPNQVTVDNINYTGTTNS